jgi:hypothetical protein
VEIYGTLGDSLVNMGTATAPCGSICQTSPTTEVQPLSRPSGALQDDQKVVNAKSLGCCPEVHVATCKVAANGINPGQDIEQMWRLQHAHNLDDSDNFEYAWDKSFVNMGSLTCPSPSSPGETLSKYSFFNNAG